MADNGVALEVICVGQLWNIRGETSNERSPRTDPGKACGKDGMTYSRRDDVLRKGWTCSAMQYGVLKPR